jgi:steroid delta-isomerase-like uncharacterized protein
MTSLSLERAMVALERLDTDAVVAAYEEPFVFEDVPSGKKITDKEGLRAYFRGLFALPDVAFSDVRAFETDSFAALEWTWSGTKRSSGEAYRVRGASVIELRNGGIARETIYYDPRAPLA